MSSTLLLKSDWISDFFIINSYLRYQFRFLVLARKAGLSGAYFAAEIGTLKSRSSFLKWSERLVLIRPEIFRVIFLKIDFILHTGEQASWICYSNFKIRNFINGRLYWDYLTSKVQSFLKNKNFLNNNLAKLHRNFILYIWKGSINNKRTIFDDLVLTGTLVVQDDSFHSEFFPHN